MSSSDDLSKKKIHLDGRTQIFTVMTGILCINKTVSIIIHKKSCHLKVSTL